tara:strand:+ start:438 stop:704 length:267 start_codon:yes stop_codon:yes gene_type:complete
MKSTYYNAITHKGKTTLTTVGSFNGDSLFRETTAGEGFIPAGYQHRPDLISNLFFGDPSHWWVILGANGIVDPFESLNVGDRINIGNG